MPASRDFTPRSEFEDIEWPAMPGILGAGVLAIERQLRNSEGWSRETQNRRQLAQLSAVVAHAQQTAPYYARRLKGVARPNSDRISHKHWAGVAPLSYGDLAVSGRSVWSAKPPADHGPVRSVPMVLPSGQTVPLATDTVTGAMSLALDLRIQRWCGWDPSARLGMIVDMPAGVGRPPGGDRTDGWNSPYAGGPCLRLAADTTVDEQIEWIRQTAPDYLVAKVSTIEAWRGQFGATAPALPSLKGVIVVGGPCDDGLTQWSGGGLGTSIVHVLQMPGLGTVGQQCPEGGQYHVPAECVLAETVDTRGRPCSIGRKGRLVATSLHNFAMPLIRIDTGLIAVVGQGCDCGRSLPTLRLAA